MAYDRMKKSVFRIEILRRMVMRKIQSFRVSTMWARGAAAMLALASAAAAGFSFAQVQGAMIERIVAQSAGPGVSPVKLERKKLTATDSPALNDVILPM